MKNTFAALLSMLCLWGTSYAQNQVEELPAQPQPVNTTQQDKPLNSPINTHRGTPFWTEDWSNGLNSTNGTWTVGGIDAIWKHSFYTTSGEWSTGTPSAGFTSAANGFMLFDADSINFIVSPNYVDRSGYLTSPAINLSGQTAVQLDFETEARYCCAGMVDLFKVQVSNDGGSTWTDFPILTALAVNAAAGNPDYISLNISAVAANQSNVRIRFNFSQSGMSHYFWSIDDLALSAPASDDLSIDEAVYDEGSALSPEIEYSMYPISHVRALNFEAKFTNVGANTQTGISLAVNVTNGATVYTGSGSMASLAVSFQDSITTTPSFTPSQLGVHTVNYTLTQTQTDATPADNLATRTFEVTDSIYARDLGTHVTTVSNSGTSYEIGNPFEIVNNDLMTSISAYIDPSTDVGTLLYMVLYQIDAGGQFLFVDKTNDVTITAGMLGTWVTIPFSIPIAAGAGENYIACAGHYGGATNIVLGSSGISPAVTSFLLDGGSATWYYITNTPEVRLNLNSSFTTGVNQTANIACFGDCNGALEATVSGGSQNYSYQWSDSNGPITGATSSTLTGLCAGTYSVFINDGSGNTATEQFTITEPTQLVSSAGAITDESCAGACDGAIDMTGVVSGGTPPYQYSSDNGVTFGASANMGNLCGGAYTVMVQDANGCVVVSNETVNSASPIQDVDICMVTVDQASIQNLIIWDTPLPPETDSVRIYRDNGASFVQIGSVYGMAPGQFIDPSTDPNVTSASYQISAVDACGNESNLSATSKTMYLNASYGGGGTTVNLLWDDYQGFTFSNYVIERDDVGNGTWTFLDQVGPTVTSYIDNNPPSVTNLGYRITVTPLFPCTVSSTTYDMSISNSDYVTGSSIGEEELTRIELFPSPNNGEFTLTNLKAGTTVEVLNTLGQVLVSKEVNDAQNMNFKMTDLAAGIYYVKLNYQDASRTVKMIVK